MSAAAEVLSDVVTRVDKLDAQAASIRLSLLKVTVYCSVGCDEIRQRAINACLAAGLQKEPVDRLTEGVHRVLAEIIHQVQ